MVIFMKKITSILFLISVFLLLSGCNNEVANDHPSQKAPAPLKLTLSEINFDKVKVMWSNGSNEQLYIVHISSSPNFPVNETRIINTSSATIELDQGIAGETIYVKVKGVWAGNESESSNIIVYTFSDNQTDNLSVKLNAGRVELNWDGEGESYNIYWSTDPNITTDSYQGFVKGVTSKNYLHNDASLPAEGTRYYLVTAIRSEKEILIGSLVNVELKSVVKSPSVLLPPKNLMASISGSDIVISWSVVNAAESYTLYRQSNNVFNAEQAYAIENAISPLTDSSVIAGDSYNYWVVAKNSESSSEISVISNNVTLPVIQAINQAPSITVESNLKIPENTKNIVQLTAVDPEKDVISFSLSEESKALFEIKNNTTLAFKVVKNFDSVASNALNNTYIAQIIASDGTNTSTKELKITITDINELPIFSSPLSHNVSENVKFIRKLDAYDPEGQALNFQVSGGDDKDLFVVDAQGNLQFITVADYEAPHDSDNDNNYQIEITISDGVHIVIKELSIRVNPFNEAPIFTVLDNYSINENLLTVVQLTADDEDSAELTYSLLGVSAEQFEIINADNTLQFKNLPDYESALGQQLDNQYQVTIMVSDGINEVSQSLTIYIKDVDENPLFDELLDSVTISENSNVGLSVSAHDPESRTLAYYITGGEDSALFSIDQTSGVIKFINTPDFEVPHDFDNDNTYILEVTVNDPANNFDKQSIFFLVKDIDETPINNMNTAINIEENNKDIITVKMTDPEGLALRYSLVGGADQNRFTIDATTGMLQFLTAPDFENPQDSNSDNVYNVTVAAKDPSNKSTSHSLNVTVTGVNEPPYLVSSGPFTVEENVTGPISLIVKDPEDDAISYTVKTGQDSHLFFFDSTNFNVSFLSAPDYENPLDGNEDNNYQVEVEFSDGVFQQSESFSVHVTNINDNAPSSSQSLSLSITENTTYIANLNATDVDGDPLSFVKLAGFDNNHIVISESGDVSFNTLPDYESPQDSDNDNVYLFSANMADGKYSTRVDWQITVTNALPLVKASIQDISYVGEQVVLRGADSLAGEPSDPIKSYVWKQLAGPSVDVINVHSENASFITPLVTSPVDITFILSATSVEGNVNSREVSSNLQPYTGQTVYNIANDFPSHISAVDGGAAYDITIEGNYAYVGGYNGLRILDITDKTKPIEVGRIDTPGTARKPAINGNIVYLADFDSGLQVIDVSDRSNPKIISSLQTPGNTLYIEISGDYAYIADYVSGILVVDISNPLFPVITTVIDTNGRFGRFQIVNEKIFFGYGCYDLRVVDVSDTSTVIAEGSLSSNNCTGDIYVDGKYAYVMDDNFSEHKFYLNIIDIENLSNFTLVSRMNNLGWATDLFAIGQKAYITLANESLQIVDLSDISNPQIITTISTPNTTNSVIVKNQIAYVADASSGFFIMDVSDLSYSPAVGEYTTPGIATKFKIRNNEAYIVDSPNNLNIADITQKDNIVLVGEVAAGEYLRDLDVTGNYVYMSDYRNALSIVDVTYPDAPLLLSTFDPSPDERHYPWGITIREEKAFLSSSWFGVYTIDINVPTNPYAVSFADTGSANATKFVGDLAYVANGNAGLQIVDYSDISNPLLLGSIDTLESTRGLDVQGNIAYLAANRPGLKIVNVINPSSPVLLGTLNTPGEVVDVKVKDSRAFLADGESGMQIADISSSVQPRILGQFNAIYANDIDYINSEVYFVTRKGLSIVDPYIKLDKQYDNVVRGEVLQYTVTWEPDPRVNRLVNKCWVSAGLCNNVAFDAIKGSATFKWELPFSTAKHEIIMGVGNESYFLTQLDRVSIQ